VRFLIDAQLPVGLCDLIKRLGHEAQHVGDLPRGLRTPDPDICAFADRDGQVLVTKDRDFVISQVLSNTPQQILLISTGNMGNSRLFQLVEQNWPSILVALRTARLVDMGSSQITVTR
jgi:predicted nuclease of predicted toxin-antitoxin system